MIQEFKEKDINVVVQGSHVLGISFINSSFNKWGELDRAEKAREIALFAIKHYAAIASINQIRVGFVAAKNYIVFNYSQTLGAYSFNKSDLENPTESKVQGLVNTLYNPSSNQTSVYLNRNLQVYSGRDGGIMMLPYFVVPGNNVSAPRIITPRTAMMDFSTTSTKRMLPDNPPFVLYVDDEKVFSGKARTTSVLGSEGEKSFNEFATQEIPYSQFVQLTNGKKVKIMLGAKELELSGASLEALRTMRRCIEQLKCD
ncbi:MAG TPA: hypothetical protein VGC66_07535 [Pyrinomonadaceae bacterium]